jgi:hypothetical protein
MPLRAQQTDNGFIKVDGTPTDCVHLAITGLLETEPDMVFAGINHGCTGWSYPVNGSCSGILSFNNRLCLMPLSQTGGLKAFNFRPGIYG